MVEYIPWKIIINRLKEEISSEEEQLLSAWLEKDEKHRAIFGEIQALWNSIVRDNLEYTSNADELWRKLKIRMQTASFISATPYMQPAENSTITDKTAKVITFSFRKFRRFAVAASFLLVVLLSFTGYIAKKWTDAHTVEQTYSSMNGKSKVVLPDGSQVWLNAGSTICYSASVWERNITLTGEALFDVTRDVGRPFVVKNSNIEIVVHGTRFNVVAREKSPEVSVSLLRGSVSVKSPKQVKTIVPGEEAVYSKNGGKIEVKKTDVDFAAIWAQETIRFEGKSISYLSKYLSKWYGVKIILDDNLPDGQAYTFSIRNEPLEEILRLMARTNPIVYHFDEENVVKISKK